MAGKTQPPGAGGGNAGDPRTKGPVTGGLYGGDSHAPLPQPKTKASGEGAVFKQFISTHKGMGRWKDLIWAAAERYGGITATELAAIIWAESKGNPDAKSNKGALGIAQIFDNAANSVNDAGVPFFRDNHQITEADKRDPKFAIQYMAWRLSGYASTHGGTIDDIWVGGYNPGYKGNPHYISQYLPKGYVGIAGRTAADTAGRSGDVSSLTGAENNPWVVGVNSKGKLVVSTSAAQPANVLMYDGVPMQVSSWMQLKRGLDQYYASYTGGRPNNNQIMQYLYQRDKSGKFLKDKNGQFIENSWSPYSLTVALSKTKAFWTSPIYKSQAPQYKDAAKDLLPQGKDAGRDLIRSAILNNWTQGAYQAVLRAQQGYVNSNEFKSNTATLMNVHTSIFGIPDDQAMNQIRQAALAGWSPDQYASYLRGQPEYVQSPEYQSKTLSFLEQLGLITGQRPILKKGQATQISPYPTENAPPNDKRSPKGSLSNPEDTIATYGG